MDIYFNLSCPNIGKKSLQANSLVWCCCLSPMVHSKFSQFLWVASGDKINHCYVVVKCYGDHRDTFICVLLTSCA